MSQIAEPIDAQTTKLAPSASELRRHNKYWLDDGSVILRAQNDLFKVHQTLLDQHIPRLASSTPAKTAENTRIETFEGLPVVHIPDELEVRSTDVEALLEHLYQDAPPSDEVSLRRAASLFRISSKQQLDFPDIHDSTRRRIEKLCDTRPEDFSRPPHAEETLALSVKYDIPSIRKALYYSVATHPHEPDTSSSTHPSTHPELSPELSARCDALLEKLIDYFTPVLFTVATAGHMACTDVFAEKWMPLVIQPALEDNGLCRPLETLERIIAIDWKTEGLCEECVRDKTEEWRAEQRTVWAKMDGWLS